MSEVVEKAGFSAAPAPEKDVLDQQAAVDAKAAETRTAEEEAQKKQAAAAQAFNTVNSDTIPDSGNERASTLCMTGLRALFGVYEIKHQEYLNDMTLATDNLDQYQGPPDGRTFIVLQTTTNTIVAAKGDIKFQNQTISAKDALQGAVLVENDLASYPSIELTGSERDRCFLMLAADALGFGNRISNRLDMNAIPADIKEEWQKYAESVGLADQLAIESGNNTLKDVLNEPQQQVTAKQTNTPATNAPDYRPKWNTYKLA